MTQAQRNLLGAGLFLSLALMGGRLAGFGREILIASSFGLSAEADVAIILLSIPDLLVNLLLSGGLSVALVPALRSADSGKEAALFFQASIVVGGGFATLATIFVMAPTAWFGLLAPGVLSPLRWLDNWMIYAIAVAIPLTALSGVSSATLNARDRFFVAGCGTLIFNLCVIGGLFYAVTIGGAYLSWLCAGIFLGALIRWLSQLLALRVGRLPKVYDASYGWVLDKQLLLGFVAGLASASLLVVVPLILRAGASWLGEGELAAFNYAVKLVELPLGIIITTLATVAFPRLSEAHDRQDTGAFNDILNVSLQRSVLLSIVIVLCGLPFIDAVISIIFGAGQINTAGLQHITALTQVALLSVPFVGISSLAAAAVNAQRRPSEVLRRTAVVMLFLPLLCLPGLWMKEPVVLMLALPVFHMMLAANLVRVAGWSALKAVLRGTFILRLGVLIFAVVLIAVLLDFLFLKLAGSWLMGPLAVWRLGLAGIAFSISAVAVLYMMRLRERVV
ncbi:murein biosynthesis integral membrane protein MurJ [Pseudomonas sp. PDM13]|uniref:murein biosynthesis integral membrane protein MurJ n=1 Tax=Pseudomonas sp. PDM13 TaxID=2769255 RepID=UPI0021E093B2|nr:lipid II flippase MurJ [Pseudomonas sp. PDM13]MCU9951386.1 hypothetical protein [Pseudomonas sp. PDM13]